MSCWVCVCHAGCVCVWGGGAGALAAPPVEAAASGSEVVTEETTAGPEEGGEVDEAERHHQFELMRRAHYGGEAEAIRKAKELLKAELAAMADDDDD